MSLTVSIHAADRHTPTQLQAALIGDGPRGLPLVEYQIARELSEDAPTTLAFAGGGSSGVVFALLSEHYAARGRRLVSFDMPGHTPDDLLGANTPSRKLLRKAGVKARAAIARFMFERWRALSAAPITIMSHSAGLIELAHIASWRPERLGALVPLGAGLPGKAAMAQAQRAAEQVESDQPFNVFEMVSTLTIPTGMPRVHFGPPENRVTPDDILSRYQGRENIGAMLPLMREATIESVNWRDLDVTIIGSEGDGIAPPSGVEALREAMETRGARVRAHIIPGDLPHMFMCFEAGAARVADLVPG